MRAGRPVLIVPPGAEFLRLNSVVIAWKDTREARRAVNDALPLLHKAREVIVVELLEAGANIVGACCGSTPEHIRAFRSAMDNYLGKKS